MDYEFALCSEDGCDELATYTVVEGGELVFYCEQHGLEYGLQRGIPDAQG